MINYYELKYLVTETFYENILQEKYTIGQSAGRCFVEFYNEITLNNIDQETMLKAGFVEDHPCL